MSIDYYQNEITLRDYFITKLEDYKNKFSAYDKFPELKQIYENVVTEIDNQITIQTNLKTKAEGAKTTAPSIAAGATPLGTGPTGCRDDKRYNEFLPGPQTNFGQDGRLSNPEVFKMVFGFIEPSTPQLLRDEGCADYFNCIKKYTMVEDHPNDEEGYKIMKLTKVNQNCPDSYFDLGKFVEFAGNETDVDLIKPTDVRSLEYKFVTNPDVADAINTGNVTYTTGNQNLKLDLSKTIFQAASQINYLEMVDSDNIPSLGVEIYLVDDTQGPACAIASYPATLYRNSYLTKSDTDQLNSLSDCPVTQQQFSIQNGYVRAKKGEQINDDNTRKIIEELQQKMKVGVLLDTEIVLKREVKDRRVYEYTRNIGDNIKTSFVWASAFVLASGYYEKDLKTLIDDNSYNNFVKICQEELIRTYKLTLQAAIKNGKENVVLTSVGGGAFGNNEDWILEAIRQALVEYQQYPLKVYYLARSIKDKYKIFEDENNWERVLQSSTGGARFASPISLSQIKKKKKKKEKKKTPEPQNIMILERKRREEKLKNLMK